MPGGTRARCRLISVTRTSSTQSVTPSWPRHGLRGGGKTKLQPMGLGDHTRPFCRRPTMVSSDGDQGAPATRSLLTTLASSPVDRLTPRAPEPSLKSRFDPLDVGAWSESSHPSNDLRKRYVAVPVTEEPGPNGLNGRLLRQTLRRHHAIRPRREIYRPTSTKKLSSGSLRALGRGIVATMA